MKLMERSMKSHISGWIKMRKKFQMKQQILLNLRKQQEQKNIIVEFLMETRLKNIDFGLVQRLH